MLIHTGEKPFQCSVCERRFRHRCNLKTHHMLHTGEKPHQCNWCGTAFREKGSLVNHIRTHTGERPFQCHFCGRTFARLYAKTRHIKLIHSDQEICSKYSTCWPKLSGEQIQGLVLESQMNRPGLSTKVRPHQCDVCGKAFRRKSRLKIHTRKHSGERPHQCDFCSRRFRRMRKLRNPSVETFYLRQVSSEIALRRNFGEVSCPSKKKLFQISCKSYLVYSSKQEFVNQMYPV